MKKVLFYALLFSTVSSLSFADYIKGLAAFQNGEYATAEAELKGCLAEKDPSCQYLSGFMSYHGLGVPQNYERAFSLFKEATEQGNTEARTFLGYMYDEGKGTKKDKRKAFELYEESSDAGDVIATMNLGVLYYSGEGIPQNYDKAFELMRSIESVKHPTLQFYLGNMYFYGFGTEQNLEEAISRYKKAAQLGSPEAHYVLGHIYQNGIGMEEPDLNMARAYYEYAAVKGYALAQFNLASMYTDGQLGVVDKQQAYAWLEEAARNDFDKAKDALDTLSRTMSSSEISRAKKEGVQVNKRILNAETETPVQPDEGYGIDFVQQQQQMNSDGAISARPVNRRSSRMMRRR